MSCRMVDLTGHKDTQIIVALIIRVIHGHFPSTKYKLWEKMITHSSRIRMTSALFSKTSWRVMMFGCWISFRMLTSRSMSSLVTPRRLDLLRLFLMNFAAYSTPVLLCRHLRTTANCPLEVGRGETVDGVSWNNNNNNTFQTESWKLHFVTWPQQIWGQTCIHFHFSTCYLAHTISVSCYGNSSFRLLGNIVAQCWKRLQNCHSTKTQTKQEENNNLSWLLLFQVAWTEMLLTPPRALAVVRYLCQTPTEERRAHGSWERKEWQKMRE